jgi:hypothetical protein
VITEPLAEASSNTIRLLGSRGRYASTPRASSSPPPPSQSMRRMPLTPAGFWASSCGPVMNPSSDIAMDTYT